MKDSEIMKRTGLTAFLAIPFLATALLVTVGCESSSETTVPQTADADHDHGHEGEDHHHAETLPEAIKELTSMRDVIRDAFGKNDIETAHGPLHEVGHVLELIPGLAEKQGLSGEALAAVKASTEKLFEAFGEVDKTLHGAEGSTYTEESEKIDAALKALTEAAAGVVAPAAAAASDKPEGDAATAPAAAPASDSSAAPKEESGK